MRSTVGTVDSTRVRPFAGLRRKIGIGAFVSATLLAATAQPALAGAELKLGDDASLTLGLGLRTSFTSLENGAGSPTSQGNSNSFSVENSRVYMNGSFGNVIKATMNFDRTGGPSQPGGMQMIDAIAQFEFSDAINVWMGRMLPPSDRANLYGPFYTSAWSYPGLASAGPSIAAGRDDGGMIWGNLFDKKFAYSLGAFNGHDRGTGQSNNANAKLLYATRLQYSFWDAETGYYRNASYLGSKSIFTVGGSYQTQTDGVGTAANPGKLNIRNVDLLIEKKTAGGWVPTLEGAYYWYGLSTVDCNSGEPGSVPCTSTNSNVGGLVAGTSYLVTTALIFPDKVGWGFVQPFIRYQHYDRTVSDTQAKQTDVGVNYLIKGFNAKISAVFSKIQSDPIPTGGAPGATTAGTNSNQFVLGAQLQY